MSSSVIISQYFSTIKGMHLLDGSGVLLDQVIFFVLFYYEIFYFFFFFPYFIMNLISFFFFFFFFFFLKKGLQTNSRIFSPKSRYHSMCCPTSH